MERDRSFIPKKCAGIQFSKILSVIVAIAMALSIMPAMVSFADEANDPVYKFVNVADGRYLYVWGNATTSNNGIMTGGDELSSQWRLSVKDDEYYVITNVNSGLVMKPGGGSSDVGGYLVQYDRNDAFSENEWQNWQIKPMEIDSDGTVYYAIINRRSGLFIQTGAGDLARQYEYNGSKEQLWKAVLVSGEPCLEYSVDVDALTEGADVLIDLTKEKEVHTEEVVEEMETVIYVSPSGDDSNAGTIDAPLKTLEAAKAAAQTINDGTKDVAVVLRGGEYVLENTLELSSEDGGRNGHSVTWRGYDGEEATISGMMEISGWQLHDEGKNIYKAKVPSGFNTRQLYVDGVKGRRSRSTSYEGDPYANLSRTCELGANAKNNRELYFYKDEVSDWSNFENVEVHLLTAWTDNVLRLKKYDENSNFKVVNIDNGGAEGIVEAAALKLQEPESSRLFNRPHPDITGSVHPNYKTRSYYYFENAYEFIDEDNEWYLDTTEDTIYIKAPTETDMSSVRVTAPRLETLVEIAGAKDAIVENLSFENLSFEGSTWLRPSEEGLVGGQACQYVLTSTLENKITAYHPASAFFAQYANNLSVDYCTFSKMGSTAVDFFCGVSESRIFSCEVYDIAGNGISVAKFVQDENTEYHEAYNPADKSEICRDVRIINNSVHDIGRECEGAVAIAAGYPEGIIIANNEIYNCPYSGISLGFGWTSADNAMKRNIIYANKIHKIGLVTCDFGATYTLSKQPQSLCTRNYIYNVQSKPWFDYGYAAMYFDEQTEGYIIRENLMHNIGPDVWGAGGINFNGCAHKNKTVDNWTINGEITNPAAKEVANASGIAADKSCEEIESEALRLLDRMVAIKGQTGSNERSVTELLGDGWTIGSNVESTTVSGDGLYLENNSDLGYSGVNVKSYALQTGLGSDRSNDTYGEDINVLQFWAQYQSTVASLYAQKEATETADEDKKDYYVYEFYPSADEDAMDGSKQTLMYADIGLYDDSHNLITSFRYGMQDNAAISPYWSFKGYAAKYEEPISYDLMGTNYNLNTVENGIRVRRNKKIRIVVTNDTVNNTHTVKWYYNGGLEGNADNSGYVNKTDNWRYFFGATYDNAVYGLGKIEVYRISARGESSHVGLGDLRVWGGDMEETGISVVTRQNVSPELPDKVTISGMKTYVQWEAVDTSAIGTVAAYGITADGKMVKAEVVVAPVNAEFLWTNLKPEILLVKDIRHVGGDIVVDYRAARSVRLIAAEYEDTALTTAKTYVLTAGEESITVPDAAGKRLFIWEDGTLIPLVRIS